LDLYLIVDVDAYCQDFYGNIAEVTWGFTVAEEILTSIINVECSLYEITLDVTFNVSMLINSNLINPANYTFTNNMYARKVDILNDDKIRLWVENFSDYDSFILTINENIKNEYGNGFIEGGNIYEVEIFKSIASYTNYSGLIRTWRSINLIGDDSERLYLAGSKGIDVLKKNTSLNMEKWAQIFDAYGVNAMFVAHFGGDYEFVDLDNPYLYNRNPDSGDYVEPNINIYLEIVDVGTSIKLSSVIIYVNNIIVFNGNEGWK